MRICHSNYNPNLKRVSALLDHLVPPAVTQKLTPLWVSVVGEQMATHCSAKVRGKVLMVQAADSLMVQRLNLMAGELLEKVKAHPEGQAVESIKISLSKSLYNKKEGYSGKQGATRGNSQGRGVTASGVSARKDTSGARNDRKAEYSSAELKQADALAKTLTRTMEDDDLTRALRGYLRYVFVRSAKSENDGR